MQDKCIVTKRNAKNFIIVILFWFGDQYNFISVFQSRWIVTLLRHRCHIMVNIFLIKTNICLSRRMRLNDRFIKRNWQTNNTIHLVTTRRKEDYFNLRKAITETHREGRETISQVNLSNFKKELVLRKLKSINLV